MNAFLVRGALLCALSLSCTPALAQRVRYEVNGQADVVAENMVLVEAAVVHELTGRPPESMGQVVFFRPAAGYGDAADVRVDEVRVDQQGLALHALPGGSWFVALVPVGTHSYGIDGEALTVDVRPGRSYFVRAAADGERMRLSQSTAMVFLNANGSRPLPRL